ncbi:MAG: DNA double-strand break repair nuclease NurA [Candidatus Hinthialibacter sp.]
MHDWMEIKKQIDQYAVRLSELHAIRRKCIEESVRILQGELNNNWTLWKEAAQQSTPHLVPDFDEPPGAVYPVNDTPPPAVLISSDGSQIFPNRHEIAPLALITTSRIRIDYDRYQDTPLLDSRARIFLQEDFHDRLGANRDVAFEDLISDERALEELETLAHLAQEPFPKNENTPVIALSDGSLILWRLAERYEQNYEAAMIEKYIALLQQFEQYQVPVAGYISSSNNREVIHLIRLVQKDQNSDGSLFKQETDPALTDTEIFSRILKKGQRSTLFHSQSKIILEKYGDQRISYFYLHVGGEIAKIEIPRWVASDPKRVDDVAAYCLQQSQIGGGYPIVLSEAHEHAVVRGPDRETFYILVEEALRRGGADPRYSSKQLRKRVPLT